MQVMMKPADRSHSYRKRRKAIRPRLSKEDKKTEKIESAQNPDPALKKEDGQVQWMLHQPPGPETISVSVPQRLLRDLGCSSMEAKTIDVIRTCAVPLSSPAWTVMKQLLTRSQPPPAKETFQTPVVDLILAFQGLFPQWKSTAQAPWKEWWLNWLRESTEREWSRTSLEIEEAFHWVAWSWPDSSLLIRVVTSLHNWILSHLDPKSGQDREAFVRFLWKKIFQNVSIRKTATMMVPQFTVRSRDELRRLLVEARTKKGEESDEAFRLFTEAVQGASPTRLPIRIAGSWAREIEEELRLRTLGQLDLVPDMQLSGTILLECVLGCRNYHADSFLIGAGEFKPWRKHPDVLVFPLTADPLTRLYVLTGSWNVLLLETDDLDLDSFPSGAFQVVYDRTMGLGSHAFLSWRAAEDWISMQARPWICEKVGPKNALSAMLSFMLLPDPRRSLSRMGFDLSKMPQDLESSLEIFPCMVPIGWDRQECQRELHTLSGVHDVEEWIRAGDRKSMARYTEPRLIARPIRPEVKHTLSSSSSDIQFSSARPTWEVLALFHLLPREIPGLVEGMAFRAAGFRGLLQNEKLVLVDRKTSETLVLRLYPSSGWAAIESHVQDVESLQALVLVLSGEADHHPPEAGSDVLPTLTHIHRLVLEARKVLHRGYLDYPEWTKWIEMNKEWKVQIMKPNRCLLITEHAATGKRVTFRFTDPGVIHRHECDLTECTLSPTELQRLLAKLGEASLTRFKEHILEGTWRLNLPFVDVLFALDSFVVYQQHGLETLFVITESYSKKTEEWQWSEQKGWQVLLSTMPLYVTQDLKQALMKVRESQMPLEFIHRALHLAHVPDLLDRMKQMNLDLKTLDALSALDHKTPRFRLIHKELWKVEWTEDVIHFMDVNIQDKVMARLRHDAQGAWAMVHSRLAEAILFELLEICIQEIRHVAKRLVKKMGGRASKEQESDMSECKICYDAQQEVVAIPCGHIFACLKCSEQILYDSSKCSICKKPVDQFVKFFHS